MEHTPKETLTTSWEEALDEAEELQSPTFSETMRVSNQPFTELIEDYLKSNPDLNDKEVAFLEKSIEMKRHNQKSREEDMAAASNLREDIINNNSSSESQQSDNKEELTKIIDALREGMELLDIDSDVQIRLDNENSDMWKKKYQFTDKEASKIGVVGLLFGKAKHRIEFYEMLGDTASRNGIDMKEEKSIAEIMSLIKEKTK